MSAGPREAGGHAASAQQECALALVGVAQMAGEREDELVVKREDFERALEVVKPSVDPKRIEQLLEWGRKRAKGALS